MLAMVVAMVMTTMIESFYASSAEAVVVVASAFSSSSLLSRRPRPSAEGRALWHVRGSGDYSSNSSRSRSSSALASSSYLDSLTSCDGRAAAAAAIPADVSASQPTSPAASTGFAHAPLSYFGLEQLVSKGPRATFDWGAPQDATRPLLDADGSGNTAQYGTLKAGAWYCSEGGWPSPNEKAHTEVFYVLDGHGCLGDADGAKHYFGSGDTVIIPKGHTGRWDVYGPIHKIWAVSGHESIEERGRPIRTQVDGYHTFAPQYLTKNGDCETAGGSSSDPLYQSSNNAIAFKTFYDVGPTQVGVWTCESPTSLNVSRGLSKDTFIHLLEGIVFLTNDGGGGAGGGGESRRCVPGDTVMLPQGWCGHVTVVEPAKKLFTTAARQ